MNNNLNDCLNFIIKNDFNNKMMGVFYNYKRTLNGYNDVHIYFYGKRSLNDATFLFTLLNNWFTSIFEETTPGQFQTYFQQTNPNIQLHNNFITKLKQHLKIKNKKPFNIFIHGFNH